MLSNILITIGIISILLSIQMILRLLLSKNDNQRLPIVLLHITGQAGFGAMLVVLGISLIYPLCYLLLIILIFMLPVSSSLLARAAYESYN